MRRGGAAEEAVHRLSRDAAAQVPEREVDRAHRAGRDAGGAVGLGEAEQEVREAVGGEAVLSDQGGAEVVAHQRRDRSRKLGGPEPAHSVLGPHPHPQVAPGHERVEVDAPPAVARERVGDVLLAVPGGAARRFGRRRERRRRVAQGLDRGDLHGPDPILRYRRAVLPCPISGFPRKRESTLRVPCATAGRSAAVAGSYATSRNPLSTKGSVFREKRLRPLAAAAPAQAFLKSSRRGSPFGFMAGTTWSRHTMGRGG